MRMSEPNSGITLPSMPAKAVERLAIRTMSGPNAAAVTGADLGAGPDRSLDQNRLEEGCPGDGALPSA